MRRDVPVKLEHILDVVALKEHIEAGNVSVQKHPIYNLRIFNYTPQATYSDNAWDSTLSLCRGLIVDMNNEVIARPFAKFWNLNTAKRPETFEAALPKSSPQIMEKMDGSLGILYNYLDQYAVATRGSFASDQAKWATKWYQNHQKTRKVVWPEGWTPLFEIIYPENRIVCSYDFEGLVLIGMVSLQTGEEMAYHHLNFWAKFNELQVAKSWSHIPENDLTANREGYVLTWFNPYIKVKVKFEEYVRLHRIVTGFNPKTVWEMMQTEPDKVRELLADNTLPADFREWLYNTHFGIATDFGNIASVSKELWYAQPATDSRKEKAEYFKSQFEGRYAALLFAMLDGKDYERIIWKMIKPKADKVFRVDGEA